MSHFQRTNMWDFSNVVRSIAHLVYPISPPKERFCKHQYYTILSYMIFKENTQELHNHHVKESLFRHVFESKVGCGRLIYKKKSIEGNFLKSSKILIWGWGLSGVVYL